MLNVLVSRLGPRTVNGLVTISVDGFVDGAVKGVANEPVNRGCLSRPRFKPSGAVAERRAWALAERNPAQAGPGVEPEHGPGLGQGQGHGQAGPGRGGPGRAEPGRAGPGQAKPRLAPRPEIP